MSHTLDFPEIKTVSCRLPLQVTTEHPGWFPRSEVFPHGTVPIYYVKLYARFAFVQRMYECEREKDKGILQFKAVT